MDKLPLFHNPYMYLWPSYFSVLNNAIVNSSNPTPQLPLGGKTGFSPKDISNEFKSDVKSSLHCITSQSSPDTPTNLSNDLKDISENEINMPFKQESDSMSKHTLQSTKWAINVWNAWVHQKKSLNLNDNDIQLKIPLVQEMKDVRSEHLDKFLAAFISEVRRFDGELYPPDSLMVLCAGIQRYLREEAGRQDLCFLDGYDKDYPQFQHALGKVVKELQEKGIGTVKRKADTFTQEMEKELWSKGVLSFHSPRGLSRAVYFYITKGFWLRSRGDHRNLLVEDLHFGSDNYGAYIELAQRYYNPKKEATVCRKSQPVRHYNVDQKICKVFTVLSYYSKLVPPHGPLYRKPIEERLDGKAMFGSAAIGVHALERIPSELAAEVGFEGYFTSRSVWVSDIPCQCNKYVMMIHSNPVLPLNMQSSQQSFMPNFQNSNLPQSPFLNSHHKTNFNGRFTDAFPRSFLPVPRRSPTCSSEPGQLREDKISLRKRTHSEDDALQEERPIKCREFSSSSTQGLFHPLDLSRPDEIFEEDTSVTSPATCERSDSDDVFANDQENSKKSFSSNLSPNYLGVADMLKGRQITDFSFDNDTTGDNGCLTIKLWYKI